MVRGAVQVHIRSSLQQGFRPILKGSSFAGRRNPTTATLPRRGTGSPVCPVIISGETTERPASPTLPGRAGRIPNPCTSLKRGSLVVSSPVLSGGPVDGGPHTPYVAGAQMTGIFSSCHERRDHLHGWGV